MSNKLDGKIAVVTGASQGIGLGIAKAFAAEGAKVYITGRRQSELDKAVAEIGHGAVAVQGDAANLADIDKLIAQVKATDGRIDVLALNAGYYAFEPFGQITEESFDKHYNTNVKGLLFTFQKALPLLPKGASVIMTGSIASHIGIAAMSVYSSTKAAIRSLMRGWIHDTKEQGIRINVLSPGHTLTPGLKSMLPEGAEAHIATTIPLGRLGTPADLGKAAVFLASSDSEYVHGIELEVDGGVAQV